MPIAAPARIRQKPSTSELNTTDPLRKISLPMILSSMKAGSMMV